MENNKPTWKDVFYYPRSNEYTWTFVMEKAQETRYKYFEHNETIYNSKTGFKVCQMTDIDRNHYELLQQHFR